MHSDYIRAISVLDLEISDKNDNENINKIFFILMIL